MSWKAYVSRNLQSIKVLACATSPTSAAAREWYINSYRELKHLNPRFPFMIRPNPEGSPYAIVEYDFARKVKVPLDGLKPEQIEEKIAAAVKDGETMPRSYHQSIAPFRLPAVIE